MPAQVAAEVWAYATRALNVPSAVLVTIHDPCDKAAWKVFTDPGVGWTLADQYWGMIPYLAGKTGVLILTNTFGNEAGADKGIRLRNVTDGVSLVEITWNGVTTLNQYESSPFTFPAANKRLDLHVKGSSATEDLQFGHVRILMY